MSEFLIGFMIGKGIYPSDEYFMIDSEQHIANFGYSEVFIFDLEKIPPYYIQIFGKYNNCYTFPVSLIYMIAKKYLERYQPMCEHDWQPDQSTAYGMINRCSKCRTLQFPPTSMTDVEQQSTYEPNWRNPV